MKMFRLWKRRSYQWCSAKIKEKSEQAAKLKDPHFLLIPSPPKKKISHAYDAVATLCMPCASSEVGNLVELISKIELFGNVWQQDIYNK